MKNRRGTWIPVVAGILRKQDKMLVGQRPKGKAIPGQWEFPGGKIEHGESPEEALVRELREELAIEAEIGPLKLATAHSYGETGILLLFYEVWFWKGEPKALHHTDLKWIQPHELGDLDLAEANRKVLDRLVETTQTPGMPLR